MKINFPIESGKRASEIKGEYERYIRIRNLHNLKNIIIRELLPVSLTYRDFNIQPDRIEKLSEIMIYEWNVPHLTGDQKFEVTYTCIGTGNNNEDFRRMDELKVTTQEILNWIGDPHDQQIFLSLLKGKEQERHSIRLMRYSQYMITVNNRGHKYQFYFENDELDGLHIKNWSNTKQVPKQIFDLRQLRSLVLEGFDNHQIPEESHNITTLVSCVLISYALTEIPDFIFDNCDLERLEIRGSLQTKIKTIPLKIGKLTKLRKFTLRGQLSALPEEFKNLTDLRYCDFNGNLFTEIPDLLFSLSNLVHLSLHENRIRILSDKIGDLISLKYLVLGNNRLKVIPSSIGNLYNLEKLGLSSNYLDKIPQTIGKLRNFRIIWMANNQIRTLPESFGNLEKLYLVNLENNCVEILPESFGNLSNLEAIELDNNQLSELPDSFSKLKKLERLNIEKNMIEIIPEYLFLMENIESIGLKGNQIKSFPKTHKKKGISLDLDYEVVKELKQKYPERIALFEKDCGMI